ncbi:MAG: hypothetical protein ABJA79_09025 [Parafilimonas sp.]
MYTTFQICETELSEDFLNAVKKLFRNETISITIEDAMDETDYLLNNPANKKRLLEAIENVNRNQNMIEVNMEDLKKHLA